MEVITGVERHQRWRTDDKLQIVAESEVPGAVISMVARRRGVARSHIFECGERAAAMYSLIVTAKLNSIALSRKPGLPIRCAELTSLRYEGLSNFNRGTGRREPKIRRYSRCDRCKPWHPVELQRVVKRTGCLHPAEANCGRSLCGERVQKRPSTRCDQITIPDIRIRLVLVSSNRPLKG